jgi:hypothetical protein
MTFNVSREALAQAEALGFDEKQVLEMLGQSAPFTNELANRRFMDYMLMFKGGVVLYFAKMERDDVKERHKSYLDWRKKKIRGEI